MNQYTGILDPVVGKSRRVRMAGDVSAKHLNAVISVPPLFISDVAVLVDPRCPVVAAGVELFAQRVQTVHCVGKRHADDVLVFVCLNGHMLRQVW